LVSRVNLVSLVLKVLQVHQEQQVSPEPRVKPGALVARELPDSQVKLEILDQRVLPDQLALMVREDRMEILDLLDNQELRGHEVPLALRALQEYRDSPAQLVNLA
jgi:hypothetical protein